MDVLRSSSISSGGWETWTKGLLAEAIAGNQLKTAQLIYDRLDQETINSCRPTWWAAAIGSIEILEWLRSKGELDAALRTHQFEVVDWLDCWKSHFPTRAILP
mgnify:CR=1 FL=1|uniref:Uncharacterized protein n=1 Tax=viral metagenome TaxID=1070528 RepID=A0A6C0IZ76_9ZZZZ